MSSSNNEENETELNPKEVIKVRRRTHAGPWRNKQEFDSVFEWIYGDNASPVAKQRACRRMVIWKLRRANLTPGTILSTLLLLEAELKDYVESQKMNSGIDMSIIYSSAFTRFLNYMSAIAQTKNIKTMYATARELNLEPFLVDLRHLCAHGHNMPSLEVFRRTSTYCLNWLREFYWETQKQTMIDVDAQAVRKKDSTYFDEKVRELFYVYDIASEAVAKGCSKVTDLKKQLTPERRSTFKRFASKINEGTLEAVMTLALKRISVLVKRGSRLKDLSQIFIDALLELEFFFEAGYDTKSVADEKSLIAQHQHLFRTMALNGFIGDLYHLLVEIAENEFESVVRRKGSGFWAKQIINGFIAFKQIKMVYKKQLEENSDEKLSLSTINEKNIARNIIKIYENLDLDVEGTLIFGDTIKCPWALSFSRQNVMERIERINEYTIDIIKSVLQLVEPILSDKESKSLLHLIDLYAGEKLDNDFVSRSDRVFTLQHDVLRNSNNDIEMNKMEPISIGNQKKFGIWTQVSDGQEWYSCPLGRLMWE